MDWRSGISGIIGLACIGGAVWAVLTEFPITAIGLLMMGVAGGMEISQESRQWIRDNPRKWVVFAMLGWYISLVGTWN